MHYIGYFLFPLLCVKPRNLLRCLYIVFIIKPYPASLQTLIGHGINENFSSYFCLDATSSNRLENLQEYSSPMSLLFSLTSDTYICGLN